MASCIALTFLCGAEFLKGRDGAGRHKQQLLPSASSASSPGGGTRCPSTDRGQAGTGCGKSGRPELPPDNGIAVRNSVQRTQLELLKSVPYLGGSGLWGPAAAGFWGCGGVAAGASATWAASALLVGDVRLLTKRAVKAEELQLRAEENDCRI